MKSKSKSQETAAETVKKDEPRTRRGKRGHGEQHARNDGEPGEGMILVDPWSLLLEQLLLEPTDDTLDEGGTEGERSATQAQPTAGSATKPERPKKRKGKP